VRLAVALAVALGLGPAFPPQPQFKSGVQLLTIDASVRDKAGTPISDLKASDFAVTIDGKPRTVVFAQYSHSEPNTIVASSDPTVGRYETNTNPDARAGHVVVFVIDRNALPPGTERPILTSAAAMLDGFSRADSVGLVEIPGRSFDVTREHARIADVLKSITGTPPPRSSARNVTWDEAKGFERGDKRVIAEVMARECESGDTFCPIEVAHRWREVLSTERAHAQVLLAGLTSVITQLEPVRGPKHLVLVSAGLPFDPEFIDRFKMFEHAAAEARVTVDTIRLHEFVGDASSDAKGGIAFNDLAVHSGVDTLATMTGGRAYAPAGTGAGTFARIASDVTSFYQLGVESLPGDANGRLHDVKVHVDRPNLDTIARPSVVAPKPIPAANLLDSALKQPVDVGAVPISVATYSMLGASNVNRIVVAAEVGAPGSPAPAEWGLVALYNGKPAASTRGRIPAGAQRPRIVMTTMELPPGAYRLRVGAVDADGSAGTIEIPLVAGAHETPSGARIGDLMIGVTSGSELEPRGQIADSDEITAIVQVADAGAEAPDGTLQFVRGGTTSAAATGPLRAVGKPGGPFTLQGSINAGTLAPGRYTAVATMRLGDQVLGRISRVMDVIPGTAPVASTGAASTAPTELATPLTTDASAAEIMKHVGAYVEAYGDAASVLVGVEKYTQKSATIGRGRTVSRSQRTLTSEMALVRNSSAIGGWLAFRDVIDVDGKAVNDRGARLAALFDGKSPDLEEARRISDESTRFNVGPIHRTFNVPTAMLFFFTPDNLRRFAFKTRGRELVGGVDATAIDFHETATPTLVMNGAGRDVTSSGTLWIDPTDGHVIKTLVTLKGYAGSSSSAKVEVSYRHLTDVDMWVPASMQEEYSTNTGNVTGEAEYADFRRFQTSVKIKK
jgi:VWFA-related protein